MSVNFWYVEHGSILLTQDKIDPSLLKKVETIKCSVTLHNTVHYKLLTADGIAIETKKREQTNLFASTIFDPIGVADSSIV